MSPSPGFTEVDLVSHSGDRADGDFLQSLNVTDIHTTWVETCAVMGKSQVRVQEALEHLRQALPFALRGIDSDNGSEFINAHLYRYCRTHQLQFTRGRPYNRDFHFGRPQSAPLYPKRLPRGPDLFVTHASSSDTVCGVHSAVELTGRGLVLGHFSHTCCMANC